MFNNAINSLHNKKTRFWTVPKKVVLVYLAAGTVGFLIGKYKPVHSEAIAWIAAITITLLAVRWIEIFRRRP